MRHIFIISALLLVIAIASAHQSGHASDHRRAKRHIVQHHNAECGVEADTIRRLMERVDALQDTADRMRARPRVQRKLRRNVRALRGQVGSLRARRIAPPPVVQVEALPTPVDQTSSGTLLRVVRNLSFEQDRVQTLLVAGRANHFTVA